MSIIVIDIDIDILSSSLYYYCYYQSLLSINPTHWFDFRSLQLSQTTPFFLCLFVKKTMGNAASLMAQLSR